jgi:chorismate mutase / prephenate dehydratase
MRVSFLGPAGTFTHMAARRLFGEAADVPVATIEGVFETVRSGEADAGVVPMENSTEGAVTLTADTLLEGDLVIQREMILEVGHALVGEGEALSRVRKVHSHPQALAQCRVWLGRHLPHAIRVETASTAAAAAAVVGKKEEAAIATPLAAELAKLSVLAKDIQDRADNATRFAVIAREDAKPTGDDKTSIAFVIQDEKGALRKVLSIFEDAGVNLTRIESRPLARASRFDVAQRASWKYVFLVDLEGHRLESRVAGALAALEAKASRVQILGSYPATHGDAREDEAKP